MMPIGLNHMTVPRKAARDLLDMAGALGCVGIEVRNDLDRPLFDDDSPETFGRAARAAGLRILALAEVKAFNADPAALSDKAIALTETAARCGAEGIALIPSVSEQRLSRADQRAALRVALDILQPILRDHGMCGLIEPLGFEQSSLRFKEDVVMVLDDMNRPDCFALIHDTFHHHLAGESAIYPELTAVIHISGVTDPRLKPDQMTDEHRVLVDARDCLGNIVQLNAFAHAGYTGPASFEAFAPEIHDMNDPTADLAGSIAFINKALAEVTAGAA